jgi:hypothetical protein
LASAVTLLRRLAWSDRALLDLRADLSALPQPRPARVPLTMQPCDDPHFPGFKEEAGRATGADLEQVITLQGWFEGGLRQLYVAWSDGQPAYCQWLVRPADRAVLAATVPGAASASPATDEVLLEGAYTFVRSRGQGAMADCMGQLLRIARDEGARSAVTCVGEENVASLKGCARVGFTADRLRSARWRLGVKRTSERPGHESATWRSIA